MDGDFRGDFTRDTFDRAKHFTRVLMQQGRVQLDADWNEQVDILLHYMRTLVTDLVGPYWGPGADDFEVVPDDDTIKFQVKKGHFYVDGILCESDRPDSSDLNEDIALKGAHIPGKPSQSRGPYVVYLDVWEREVTSIEDDGIREVALGGPDTTSRAKVMWKVRVRSDIPHKNQLPAADKKDALKEHVLERWSDWVKQWYPEARGSLDVRCNEDAAQETTPKLTSPASKYRGVENQLYRVEIHKGGKSSDGATFKWSRENGSAIFPIVGLAEKVVTVKHLERGGRFGLRPNDRVEIVGDDSSSGDSPAQLLQVDKVDCVRMQVTLTEVPVFGRNQKKPRFLRRWDHQDSLTIDSDGAALIEESKWLSLEDGIQIKFLPSGSPTYRSGDYWLIPARTANGDVQWPQPGVGGRRGVEHHFAPLAIILTETNGTGIKDIIDLRTLIKPEGQETIPGGSTPASGAATPGTARASRRRTTGSGSGETPEESTPQ